MQLTVEPRKDHALLADATVRLAEEAPIYLEYGQAGASWLRSPTTPARIAHREPVLRLRPQTTYEIRAFMLGPTGCPVAFAAADLTAGALPRELRSLAAQTSGAPSFPLTLMDIRSTLPFERPDGTGSKSNWLVMFEHAGEIVWYYELPPTMAQANHSNAFTRLRNGNLLYLATNLGFEEITPDARLVRRVRTTTTLLHHDMLELSDGRVLYVGSEVRDVDTASIGGSPNLRLRGDTLNILDLDADQEWQVWSAFDFLDPLDRQPQWLGESRMAPKTGRTPIRSTSARAAT